MADLATTPFAHELVLTIWNRMTDWLLSWKALMANFKTTWGGKINSSFQKNIAWLSVPLSRGCSHWAANSIDLESHVKTRRDNDFEHAHNPTNTLWPRLGDEGTFWIIACVRQQVLIQSVHHHVADAPACANRANCNWATLHALSYLQGIGHPGKSAVIIDKIVFHKMRNLQGVANTRIKTDKLIQSEPQHAMNTLNSNINTFPNTGPQCLALPAKEIRSYLRPQAPHHLFPHNSTKHWKQMHRHHQLAEL